VTVIAENRDVPDDELPGIPSGEYVRICVADTGTGISPEHLEKVLEPFFTTKDVGKGSGLGLSMVYGFAKQSNGAFRLDSEWGSGTQAELWLPRAPHSALGKTEQLPEPESRPLRPLKVLLVDDHPEVRSTTAALLEDYGHEVRQADNGAVALDLLKKRKCDFDILITDYAMPHLSGTDFLREARLLCPDVPALLVTGYAEIESIRDRPPSVEVLLKPFTPAKLEAAIVRSCGSDVLAS
jgi:CheY-like chemotaxis protein